MPAFVLDPEESAAVADARTAAVAVAETMADQLRLNALIEPDQRKKIEAHLVTPPDIASPGSVTVYGPPT